MLTRTPFSDRRAKSSEPTVQHDCPESATVSVRSARAWMLKHPGSLVLLSATGLAAFGPGVAQADDAAAEAPMSVEAAPPPGAIPAVAEAEGETPQPPQDIAPEAEVVEDQAEQPMPAPDQDVEAEDQGPVVEAIDVAQDQGPLEAPWRAQAEAQGEQEIPQPDVVAPEPAVPDEGGDELGYEQPSVEGEDIPEEVTPPAGDPSPPEMPEPELPDAEMPAPDMPAPEMPQAEMPVEPVPAEPPPDSGITVDEAGNWNNPATGEIVDPRTGNEFEADAGRWVDHETGNEFVDGTWEDPATGNRLEGDRWVNVEGDQLNQETGTWESPPPAQTPDEVPADPAAGAEAPAAEAITVDDAGNWKNEETGELVDPRSGNEFNFETARWEDHETGNELVDGAWVNPEGESLDPATGAWGPRPPAADANADPRSGGLGAPVLTPAEASAPVEPGPPADVGAPLPAPPVEEAPVDAAAPAPGPEMQPVAFTEPLPAPAPGPAPPSDTDARASVDEAARIAAGFGLEVTSAHRPGAITASGNPSDHGGDGPERAARDLSNGVTTPEMDRAVEEIGRAYGRDIDGSSTVKEFFNHGGLEMEILYRTWTGGNHFNHIHVGAHDALTQV